MSRAAANPLGKRKVPDEQVPVAFPVRCDGFIVAGALDEALVCCVRQGVLYQPLQHKACGNCVCRGCLESIAWKCPLCVSEDGKASPPSIQDYVQPAKPLLAMLDKIMVKCPACDDATPLGSITHHEKHACRNKERFAAAVEAFRLSGRCTLCRDMYAAPGQKGKCSNCFFVAHGNEVGLEDHPVIKRIRADMLAAQPDWELKHLDALFYLCKPNHRILTAVQATVLIDAYKDKTLDEMLAAFQGQREFPPFVLRAEDAERLLLKLHSRLVLEPRFAHLILPRILDRWMLGRGAGCWTTEREPLQLESYFWCYHGCDVMPKKIAHLQFLWRDVGTDHIMF